MNNQPAPFSPFAPVLQPVAPIFEAPPAKKKTGRKAKIAKPVKEKKKATRIITGITITNQGGGLPTKTEVHTAPKQKRAARKARPATIPIGILPALAGLKEVEAAELMRLVTELQAWAKKPRSKIVMALAKVFA